MSQGNHKFYGEVKTRYLRMKKTMDVPTAIGPIKIVLDDWYRNEDIHESKRKAFQAGHRVPTPLETVAVFHFAQEYKGDHPILRDIADEFENYRASTFPFHAVNFWFHGRARPGVYIAMDDCPKNFPTNVERGYLDQLLEGGKDMDGVRSSKDGRVSYIPDRILVGGSGDKTKKQISTHPYLIALLGKSGVELLADTSLDDPEYLRTVVTAAVYVDCYSGNPVISYPGITNSGQNIWLAADGGGGGKSFRIAK